MIATLSRNKLNASHFYNYMHYITATYFKYICSKSNTSVILYIRDTSNIALG